VTVTYSERPEADASPEEAAAAWYALLLSGDATDADTREIETWRASAPTNALAWSRIAALWDYSESEAQSPAILAMRRAALARSSQRRRPWVPVAIAASLAIAVGAGMYSANLIPGLGPSAPEPAAGQQGRVIRTTVGQQENVALNDGSNITVNTDSVVDVAFTPSQRGVKLVTGEAYFKVAKDERRPFVVAASDLTVTAVGTQFSVRAQDDTVTVVLREGRARVERKGGANPETVMLEAGSLLRATAAGFVVTRGNAERLTSWTTGRLSFEQTPLNEVVAEFNRYSTRKIAVAEPSLGAMPVTGLFIANKPEGFAEIMAASGGVRVERRPDGSILLKAPR
jgi:transmembrane sensor